MHVFIGIHVYRFMWASSIALLFKKKQNTELFFTLSSLNNTRFCQPLDVDFTVLGHLFSCQQAQGYVRRAASGDYLLAGADSSYSIQIMAHDRKRSSGSAHHNLLVDKCSQSHLSTHARSLNKGFACMAFGYPTTIDDIDPWNGYIYKTFLQS